MSYEELVKRISPTLKRITYKLNGHFSFFNDEDLFQEALLRLWQDFQAGKLEDKTDSYILQGCYFHLKNYLRMSKVSLKTLSLQALINERGESLEDCLCLEDAYAADYLERLDNKLLVETICNNGLSEKEKEALYFLAQDLTTRQIGQRLGVSHVRVVKLMARIRKKCQKYRLPK